VCRSGRPSGGRRSSRSPAVVTGRRSWRFGARTGARRARRHAVPRSRRREDGSQRYHWTAAACTNWDQKEHDPRRAAWAAATAGPAAAAASFTPVAPISDRQTRWPGRGRAGCGQRCCRWRSYRAVLPSRGLSLSGRPSGAVFGPAGRGGRCCGRRSLSASGWPAVWTRSFCTSCSAGTTSMTEVVRRLG
jgi:hypothetical protein